MRPIAIVAFLVLLAAAVTGGASALAASAEEEHASGPVLMAAAPLTMVTAEAKGQPSGLDAGPLLVAAEPPASIASSAPAPITVTSMPAAADPAPPCPPGAAIEKRPLITVYAWLPAISATIGVDDIEASVDASISDVLHHFKGGGAAHYESGGRTNVVLDVLYAKLEGTKNTPDTSIDFTVKQWLVEAGVTLGRTGTANQFGEGLIGGRYFSISNDISLSPQAVTASDTKAWAEPFVGGRYGTVLSPKWFLLLTGDVGGFGVGSHLTWEGAAEFRYSLSPTTELELGYRYLHIDYDKSGFEFTGSLAGPLIGVSWLL